MRHGALTMVHWNKGYIDERSGALAHGQNEGSQELVHQLWCINHEGYAADGEDCNYRQLCITVYLQHQ